MKENHGVLIPNEMLEEMEFEAHIISPVYEEIGVLIMKDEHYVVRVYKTETNDNNEYEVIDEIGAFQFATQKQMREFIGYLPNMTALELMMIQYNALEPSFQ